MQEIYKDVLGYEGLYQVSNFGNVLSLKRYRPNGQIIQKKDKSKRNDGKGYYTVSLWKNNIEKNIYIHRLVIEAFVSKIPAKMEVNHIDGIKTNNNLSNLEIVTRSGNIQHAYKTGLIREKLGEKKKNNNSGYSNICIKKDNGINYFQVCIRAFGRRFERRYKDLYEAIVIHNQYMREIGKEHLVHSI